MLDIRYECKKILTEQELKEVGDILALGLPKDTYSEQLTLFSEQDGVRVPDRKSVV